MSNVAISLGEQCPVPGSQTNCILLVKLGYSPTTSRGGLDAATVRRDVLLTNGLVIEGAALAFLDRNLAEALCTESLHGEAECFEYPFPPEQLKDRIDEPIILILARAEKKTWRYALNP